MKIITKFNMDDMIMYVSGRDNNFSVRGLLPIKKMRVDIFTPRVKTDSNFSNVVIVKYGIYPPEDKGKIKWVDEKCVGRDIESIRHLFPKQIDKSMAVEGPFGFIDVENLE